VIAGAGVVALGVGALFLISGGSKRDDADRLRERYPGSDYRCSAGGPDCAELADLTNSAESQKTIGTGFLIGAGALFGTAAATFFLWPQSNSTTGIRVSPTVTLSGAGAVVGGRF
jgi:hypothetical protein